MINNDLMRDENTSALLNSNVQSLEAYKKRQAIILDGQKSTDQINENIDSMWVEINSIINMYYT